MIETVIGLFGIVCLLAAWTDPRPRFLFDDVDVVSGSLPRSKKRFRAPSDPEGFDAE